jgi:hypothetical protein
MSGFHLGCTGFQVDVAASRPIVVNAQFVLSVHGASPVSEIAAALSRVTHMLGSEIDLVRSAGRPRCFYCGSLNAEDRVTCSQCGGSLDLSDAGERCA